MLGWVESEICVGKTQTSNVGTFDNWINEKDGH